MQRVGSRGIPGPQGPQGPQGPPGPELEQDSDFEFHYTPSDDIDWIEGEVEGAQRDSYFTYAGGNVSKIEMFKPGKKKTTQFTYDGGGNVAGIESAWEDV